MSQATLSCAGRDAIEHASHDELENLQLERLKWTLRHAYENVPHYKQAFDEQGVHPDDLTQLSDLKRFPFTTKQDLRNNYPYGMFAVPRERISRIHASSGTTGKPTVVGYTANDINKWADLVARSLWAAGAAQYRTRGLWLGCSPGARRPLWARAWGAQWCPCPAPNRNNCLFRTSNVSSGDAVVLLQYSKMQRQNVDPRRRCVSGFGAEPWTGQLRAILKPVPALTWWIFTGCRSRRAG